MNRRTFFAQLAALAVAAFSPAPKRPRLRRWYFVKAFRPENIIAFPSGSFVDENGVVNQNEDYARQLVERAESGSVLTIPSGWQYYPGGIHDKA